jgi:peptidoglycan/LPS O-acetylase OafA/YrhL
LVDGNRSREILTRLFGTISFGVFAVDGFFLVSGYLITQSYLQSENLDYFLKRVMRIYPAYIVAFIISIGLGGLSLSTDSGINVKIVLHNLLNLFFLLPPIIKNSYPGSYYPDLNGAMWTISYEFHCYLTVFALGILGMLRRRFFVFFLALILVAAYSIHPEIYVTPIYNSSRMIVGATANLSNSFSFSRLLKVAVIEDHRQDIRLFGIFLMGSCFNLFHEQIDYRSRYAILALISLVLCLFSNHLAETGLAIFGGYLVFWFALRVRPLRISKFFNSIDLSYGIYLYGWPVQKTLIRLIPSIDPYTLCLVSLFFSAVLACFSWKLIEKPCMNLRKRVLFFLTYAETKIA